MPQADFFAESCFFANEIMFEEYLSELADPGSQVSKIHACYLYDIDYECSENEDAMELTLLFTAGILFDYKCDNSSGNNSKFKEIPCLKKLFLSKKLLSGHFSEAGKKKYFINNLSNTTFYTQSPDNGDEMLVITASIEITILPEYHCNFWVCSKLNLPPPTGIENCDWINILKNINIEDVVMLFENLLTLVKGLCCGKPGNQTLRPGIIPCSEPWNPKKDIACTNINNCRERDELNNAILQLKKEISDRDYIINGLLKYLNKKDP